MMPNQRLVALADVLKPHTRPVKYSPLAVNDQTLINETLRAHIQHQHEPLEKTLRRVLRKELKQNGH